MLERVLFILVVCGVYLGMNWYVLGRLFKLFALNRTIWFYLALIPLTLSFIGALVLESTIGNRLTGLFFTLAMIWLGVCFLLLWLLFVQQVLSWVLPIPRRIWAAGICGLAVLLGEHHVEHPQELLVAPPVPEVAADLDGLELPLVVRDLELLLAVALTIFSTLVFSYGLGLPFRRFGPWLPFN